MNIRWLNLHPDTCNPDETWDTTMLRDLLDGRFGPVPNFGDVVCISGRHHYEDIDAINVELSKYSGVVVIIHSDEESLFPTDKLDHPNMRLWVQTPKHAGDFMAFPVGYTPHTRDITEHLDTLHRQWMFAGQVTNERRREAAAAMAKLDDGFLFPTAGFTQGLARDTYTLELSASRFAPCPSGPVIADCFRIWEALQVGTIPIVDKILPDGDPSEYASDVSTVPFTAMLHWGSLGGVIDTMDTEWLQWSNYYQAWWCNYKTTLRKRLVDDVEQTTQGRMMVGSGITVLIPTSPVAAHPSTEIIEATVESVRERLPHAEIRIMVDGIRDEQEHYRARYELYTRRLLYLANHVWGNVTVDVHGEHRHQVKMTRMALTRVDTETILFVEHDTPLVGDIDFPNLVNGIEHDDYRIVRLHHESHVLEVHMHLMIGDEPSAEFNAPVWPTRQWSQRPHLASTKHYRRWLDEWFGPRAISMIEDRMHGAAQERDWDEFKIVIYTPDGDSIQRSTHLDARGEDPKFAMDFDNA